MHFCLRLIPGSQAALWIPPLNSSIQHTSHKWNPKPAQKPTGSRGLPHIQIWGLQCPQAKPLIHRDRVQWEPKRGQSGTERPIQAFWVKICIKMPFYSDEELYSSFCSSLVIAPPPPPAGYHSFDTIANCCDVTGFNFSHFGSRGKGDWGRECDRRQE